MGQLTEGVSIPLQTPNSGMNTRIALPNMPANYSPWILNAEVEGDRIKCRNGYVIHNTISTSVGFKILALGVWGATGQSNAKLFAYCDEPAGGHKIYDVTTSTASLSDTLAGSANTETEVVNFAQRLAFINKAVPADESDIYDGSAWTSWGFTSGGSDIGGLVATSYKGRLYFATGANATVYVGDLDTVTGPTTTEDLQYVLEIGGYIYWMAQISSAGNRSEETFLAFGSSSGEVLVYGGDYPASATWGLVGRFKIGTPTGLNCVIPYQNDVWIMTTTGIVSLRSLFTAEKPVPEFISPSAEINSYWTKLVSKLMVNGAVAVPLRGVYWPERNKILILIPAYIDENGTEEVASNTMLVYDILAESWCVHRLANLHTTNVGGLVYFNGNVYFYSDKTVMTVSLTGYKDETHNSAGSYSAISGEVQGAYSSVGTSNLNKRVVGIQPIFKTDFAGTGVSVEVASDIGRKVSDPVSVELVNGYNQPYYPVGVDGTYVQYRFLFTSDVTSTDGLELYANAAIVIPGGRG